MSDDDAQEPMFPFGNIPFLNDMMKAMASQGPLNWNSLHRQPPLPRAATRRTPTPTRPPASPTTVSPTLPTCT
jgi:hypothetical protein